MTLERLPDGACDAEDVYEIYQMTYAREPGRQVRDNFMFVDMHDGSMPMDFNVWILRNRHRTVLVDTGFGARAAAERGRPIDFEPVDGLARIGVDPDGIKDIVLTHLHFDHAGGLDRFAGARFHIQDAEVAFATGRCMCDGFIRRTFDVEDVVTLVRRTFAERVVFHDGDDDLLPGLTLHVFPGHSAAVQGVGVRTARGRVVLASDATHYYANALAMKPFNVTVDARATLQSFRKLRGLAPTPDLMIPGHDPKLRRMFPAIEVNGIELLCLHAEPRFCDPGMLIRTDDC